MNSINKAKVNNMLKTHMTKKSNALNNINELLVEYLKAKNNLVKSYVNETLTPDDQIVSDVIDNYLQAKDIVKDLHNYVNAGKTTTTDISVLSSTNCPYCSLYNYAGNSCDSCPMSEAGNCCTNPSTTYDCSSKAVNVMRNHDKPLYRQLTADLNELASELALDIGEELELIGEDNEDNE